MTERQKPLLPYEMDWAKIKYPFLFFSIMERYSSLGKFCQENGLCKATLHNVLYGKNPPRQEFMLKCAEVLRKDTLLLFAVNPEKLSEIDRREMLSENAD